MAYLTADVTDYAAYRGGSTDLHVVTLRKAGATWSVVKVEVLAASYQLAPG